MNWEFDWLYAMQQIHNPVLDPSMVGLSALGNAGILWIIISVICLIKKETRRCGVQMIISMLVVLVIGNGILKNLVCRQRPCWIDSTVTLLVKNPSDYSFPSGHSMNSFTAAVTIWFYHKKAGAAAIAVATPTMFPVPIVAERAVQRAPKEETSPFPVFDLKIDLKPSPSLRN